MSKKGVIARPLGAQELAAWDDLARCNGGVFNSVRWSGIFGPALQRIGIFDAGGGLLGGFCIYEQRKFGLRIWRNPPYTPQIGPFFVAKATNPAARTDEQRAVVEAMAEYLAAAPAALVSLGLPLIRDFPDALPFFWRGFKVVPHYTYLLDLSVPLEQIRKNMAADRRNDISKAGRDGLEIRPATDLAPVRELVLATFDRQDKFLDSACLENILTRFATPDNSYGYLAFRGEQPIAACFVIHDAQTAYYLLGGYRASDRHHGAGAMAVFEAIHHAQELGLKTFDFEGSVIPPIERYFRGFGGQLTPRFTVHKAWVPLELALHLNPRLRNRF